MKTFAFISLCAATLLGGCDSMSSRVHERFADVPPHTRIFAAPRRVVFDAAKVAVKNIDLLVGRTSVSQGTIEAYAPIRTGDSVSDTRQTTMTITLAETDAGATEVSLLVFEQTEGNFPGGVSQQALREHSLYELYYAALQQVLQDSGAIKASANP
jgi:outer membrane protein assembly factor BamA